MPVPAAIRGTAWPVPVRHASADGSASSDPVPAWWQTAAAAGPRPGPLRTCAAAAGQRLRHRPQPPPASRTNRTPVRVLPRRWPRPSAASVAIRRCGTNAAAAGPPDRADASAAAPGPARTTARTARPGSPCRPVPASRHRRNGSPGPGLHRPGRCGCCGSAAAVRYPGGPHRTRPAAAAASRWRRCRPRRSSALPAPGHRCSGRCWLKCARRIH